MQGMLFNLQDWAVHDGAGIRTAVFLKGCPLRCAWCCNPESQRPHPELRHFAARCTQCFRCVAACPHSAATQEDVGPHFDRAVCDACTGHECVDECCDDALTVVGHLAETADIVADVARDAEFYRLSGGGATVSGGEPFSQAPFLLELLRGFRERGIDADMETCGHARTEDMLAAAELVDKFLFDVKVVDPDEHRRCTGVGNERIQKNLRALARHAPGQVIVRLPLIPGYTDSSANVRAVADLAVELGVEEVDVEPYHAMGVAKYRETGKPEPPAIEPPDAGAFEAAASIFLERGLRCELP